MEACAAPSATTAVNDIARTPTTVRVAAASVPVAADASEPAHGSKVTEFLAFKLGREEYGIDILRVQEIRSFERPMHLAGAPAHILGVLDLRGLVVPIVDLRIRFNLETADYGDFTVTIVLVIGERVVGAVVDAVSDVVTLSTEALRPMPDLHCNIDNDHLLAIGAIDRRMLILMDIERLMTHPAMGLFDAASSG